MSCSEQGSLRSGTLRKRTWRSMDSRKPTINSSDPAPRGAPSRPAQRLSSRCEASARPARPRQPQKRVRRCCCSRNASVAAPGLNPRMPASICAWLAA